MPRFGASGHDMALCQICCRDVDTGRETVKWRTDVTERKVAGNVCERCLDQHAITGLTGDELRKRVRGCRR